MDSTVLKGLTLIEALASSERPRGVSELSREMRLTKSNVQRLLTTLVELGYAERDPVTSQYSATLRMWEFGHRVLSRDEIKRAATAQMRALYDEFDETVLLSVSRGYDELFIDVIAHPDPIRVPCNVGERWPQWRTVSGKVMLAHRPAEAIEAALNLMQEANPAPLDRKAWQDEFERIRSAGFAVSVGGFRPGVNGIAAPIRASRGNVVASIALTGPAERLTGDLLASHSLKLVHASLRVSHALGFSG
jgi:IclR family transcriptional regulator, KDG regulon repressor